MKHSHKSVTKNSIFSSFYDVMHVNKQHVGLFTVNKYKVTVFTGDKRGAGTDANVFCTLFGEFGESSEIKLSTNKNNFERAQ